MASVVSVLFRKKAADLSRGYYTRGAEVWPPNRSKYNRKPDDASCEIGMGIVQALLAVLSGHVDRFSWTGQGQVGYAHFASTSSPDDYDFTWDERDPDLGLFGGFANGPTYQLAMLHLILCYLDSLHGGGDRSAELMECWFTLVEVMTRLYPRRSGPGGAWTKSEVAAACGDSEVRPHIEHTSDAMWFAMRYRLPDMALDRGTDLYREQVIALPLVSPTGTELGSSLFLRPRRAGGPTLKARRVRQELGLALDEAQLQRLAAVREERMVGPLPAWHFPDPFEEEQ